MALINKIVGRRVRANDLTQETFVKAFSALDRYRPERKFAPWIFRIANNTTLDYVERKRLDSLDSPYAVTPGQIDALATQMTDPSHTRVQFLRHIDSAVPKHLDVHLVVDNCATHKHAKVRHWLAARPRFHVHYTPTYASWLNQVEIWFNIITQRAIRRGTFRTRPGPRGQDRSLRTPLQSRLPPVHADGHG